MNRFTLILGALFFFNMKVFAHGEEAIVVSAPLLVYFLILPVFISNWDYRNIIKNIPKSEFSKKGLWIQNYLIGFITYFLCFMGIAYFENKSEIASILLFVGLIFTMEIFGKSMLYYRFNASRKITYLVILKSIYKLNIAIIIAAFGLVWIISLFF
jgi:hypothetical protein